MLNVISRTQKNYRAKKGIIVYCTLLTQDGDEVPVEINAILKIYQGEPLISALFAIFPNERKIELEIRGFIPCFVMRFGIMFKV